MACSGWDFALKNGTLNSPSSYKQAKKLILPSMSAEAFPQCLDTHSQEACHSDKQTRTWKMKWCHNSGMHISSSLQLLYKLPSWRIQLFTALSQGLHGNSYHEDYSGLFQYTTMSWMLKVTLGPGEDASTLMSGKSSTSPILELKGK
jgi:hypothetical protein